MKLTEQQLKQIIKEELDDMMDEPMEELPDLIGADLSDKEREQSVDSSKKSIIAKEMSDILLDLQAQGVTKEQIMSFIQQKLNEN